jgi:outer membrane immunogenic protein
MHRFLTVGAGLLSLVGFAGPASAADLQGAVPAAAYAAPPIPFSWTGCFAGVHAGGAFSDDKIHSSGDFSSAGFIGGGQVGCDYQFAPAWVVGVEGRAAWASLTSKTPGSATQAGILFPTQFTVSNDFLASATARAGYSVAPGWLIYGRGGVAWTRENSNIAFTSPASGLAVDPSGITTATGWIAGGGLDWAVAPHWSVNVEYDYYNFGTHNLFMTDTINHANFTSILTDKIQTVTAGLDYRF